MPSRIQAIREAAVAALTEGRCDVVAGYQEGAMPMRAQPFLARTPEEAQTLVWSSFCVNNLAKLILGRKGKIGIVAQGCVSRNLVGLFQEQRLVRENLYIIGVPCLGMAERRKIEARVPAGSASMITAVVEDEDGFLVTAKGVATRMARKDVLRDNCYTCLHRNPVLSDVVIGEAVEETGGGNIDKTAAPWEALTPPERLQRFQENYKECIRCYACRDVCPLCSCQTCFTDESGPQWVGKGADFADIATYHILRAFHCAGRCTDCGACESACPMNIKVRRLTSKLEKDTRKLYGHEAGARLDKAPPLTVYRPDDPQDFIK